MPSHGHACDQEQPTPASFDSARTHARTHARTRLHPPTHTRSRPEVVSRLAQKDHLPGIKRRRERGRRGVREEGGKEGGSGKGECGSTHSIIQTLSINTFYYCSLLFLHSTMQTHIFLFFLKKKNVFAFNHVDTLCYTNALHQRIMLFYLFSFYFLSWMILTCSMRHTLCIQLHPLCMTTHIAFCKTYSATHIL